jgi:parvulin-like peptidyl-prolyl isomerase
MAGSSAGCGGGLPDDAVAKVGSVYITVADFERELALQATEQGISDQTPPETYRRFQQWVLENLVQNQLALLEAEQLGFTVTAEEVQTKLDAYVTFYYAGDLTAFTQALAGIGLTLDDFRQMESGGLLRQKVADEITKDVTGVSEAELLAYYGDHRADYYQEASRTVRHILIKPAAGAAVLVTTTSTTGLAVTTTTGGATTTTSATTTSSTSLPAATNATITEADWAAALVTAQEVKTRLVAGEDWSALASQYSDDAASKDSGGVLGNVYADGSRPLFEQVVFSLQLNEISEPLKTTDGYEIIQVTAITEASYRTLEQVREQLRPDVLRALKQEVWDAWVEQKKTEVGVVYRDDLRPDAASTDTQVTVPPVITGTTSSAPAATTTTVRQ